MPIIFLVYGALMGRQNNGALDIIFSVELPHKTEKGGDIVFEEIEICKFKKKLLN